jgi:hypothetical protein
MGRRNECCSGLFRYWGLALEHRSKPGALLVIFSAYFDEADTHGPAPTIVMAAFLAHTYQWRRFEAKLGRLQARDNFSVFHGKDFKARAKEFNGWSDDKGMRLISDLTELVRDNLTEGIAVHLERARYLTEYRAPPIPRKMALDSQYGVCFRSCMAHIFDVLGERGYRDKLHVVIERGHPNVWDCERIFNDMKDRWHRRGVDLMGSFTVETKQSCRPLMISDFLAGAYSMKRTLAAAGTLNYADIAPPPPPGEAGLTFLELQPDALRHLKENFETDRQQQIALWRARRDTRRGRSRASGILAG